MIDQLLVYDGVYFLFDARSCDEFAEHQVQATNQHPQFALNLPVSLHEHHWDVLALIFKASVHKRICDLVKDPRYLFADFHKHIHVRMNGNYFLQLARAVGEWESMFRFARRRELWAGLVLVQHGLARVLDGG